MYIAHTTSGAVAAKHKTDLQKAATLIFHSRKQTLTAHLQLFLSTPRHTVHTWSSCPARENFREQFQTFLHINLYAR